MAKEILLPELAESVVEGEILEWLVSEGEEVALEQPLLEIATDKVTVELPSPYAGTLVRQLVKAGETVSVHAPIAVIEDGEADQTGAVAAAASEEAPEEDEADDGERLSLFKPDAERQAVRNPFAQGIDRRRPVDERAEQADEEPTEPPGAAAAHADFPGATNRYGRVLAVPAARILARELEVNIARVLGSGPNGRVRAEDVRAFASEPAAAESAPQSAPGDTAVPEPQAPAPGALPPPVAYHTPSGYAERESREPLRGVRKAIARQMSASHLYAARTLAVDEADLSRLVDLRERLKPRAESRGVRLSYLPFVFKALVWALQQYPDVNSSLDEATAEIVHKTYYNLGLAVATEAGLVVPVVRDADTLSILEIGREINRLADKARAGELAPADMHGSSFSVTNIGSIGTLFSFPIINVPDAAILGVHAVKERPVAVDGQVVVRPMMYLSLSFDHRLVDGAEAARFLKEVIRLLEDPGELLLEAV